MGQYLAQKAAGPHTPHIKTYRVGVDGRQMMQVVEQVVGLLLVDGSRAIERLGHQVRGLDHSGSSGGRHDDGGSRPACVSWWGGKWIEVSKGECNSLSWRCCSCSVVLPSS